MERQSTDNIQVMVRVRPLNERERREGARSCITLDEATPNRLLMDTKPDQKQFIFDFVGGDNTTQDEIFQIAAKPLMMAALEGYNACIFAYGQTGAGKTYTMQGRGLEDDRHSIERGVQPRVFDHLFDVTNSDENVEYLVKCSYFEIYNEQIMDLLSNTSANLMVREDLRKGVYIEGLTEEAARNSEETIQLLLKGMRNRHVGATNMNSESSRSHSVFSIMIESKRSLNDIVSVKASKLHFVDLAGSERQKQTAAAGERLKEASNINKSLTTLGLVINSLVESAANGRNRHIQYRDSKLTFLLKDSLGGNSRTYMIAAVSAASTSFQETLSTLQFAQRAKMIKNKASINEEAQGNVDQMRKEIKRLNEELQALTSSSKILSADQVSFAAFRGCSKCLNKAESDIEIEDENENCKEIIKRPQLNLSDNDVMKELLKSNGQVLATEEEFEKHVNYIMSLISNTFQSAITRRDAQIAAFRTGISLYESMESRYQDIIRGFSLRKRTGAIVDSVRRAEEGDDANNREGNSQQNNCIRDGESDNQQEATASILEVLEYMHTDIAKIVEENVMLQGKIDNQVEVEATSVLDELKAIREGVLSSISDRRLARDVLERFQVSIIEDENQREPKVQAIVDRVKNEYEHELERLRSELVSSNERSQNQERLIETERLKQADLKAELVKLKEVRAQDLLSHSEEIEQILQEFQVVDGEKNIVEQGLSVKLVDLESKILSYKQQVTDLNGEVKEKERLNTLEIEKNSIIQIEYHRILSQKVELEREVNSLKKSLFSSTEDIQKLTKASQTMKEQLRNAMDKLTNEKSETHRKSEHMIRLSSQLKHAEERLSEEMQEKLKHLEELGVVTETLRFQNEEICEQKQLVINLSEQILSLKHTIFEYKNFHGELEHTSGKSDSTRKMSMKEISEENNALKVEITTLNNRIIDLSESEKHFKSALFEVRNQLQIMTNSNKEMVQILKGKEVELTENMKEMLSQQVKIEQQIILEYGRGNWIFLKMTFGFQDKINSITKEMKAKEREADEADNRLIRCKEAVIKLQENLRLKMDELQQEQMKVGEQETELTVLRRELTQIKSENDARWNSQAQNILTFVEKFREMSSSNKLMQRIVTSKIEENISLVAHNRLLQKLVEQFSFNEIKANGSMELLKEDFIKVKQEQELQVGNLKGEVNKMIDENKKNQKLEEAQKAYKIEINSLKGQLKAKQDEIETHLNTISSINLKLQETITQHQKVLQSKEDQIKKLSNNVDFREQNDLEVQGKLKEIQQGVLRVQQVYKQYQTCEEENKQFRVEIELREAQIRVLEKSLSTQQDQQNNAIKQQSAQIDSKYQNLKKQYATLKEQMSQKTKEAMELAIKLASTNEEMKSKCETIAKLRSEKTNGLPQQLTKSISTAVNDIPSDISTFIHGLCDFVYQQLRATSLELLVNVPSLNQSNQKSHSEGIQADMTFMVQAFNNLFEFIKTKETLLLSAITNEMKQNKRISQLEKENIMLKGKIESENSKPNTQTPLKIKDHSINQFLMETPKQKASMNESRLISSSNQPFQLQQQKQATQMSVSKIYSNQMKQQSEIRSGKSEMKEQPLPLQSNNMISNLFDFNSIFNVQSNQQNLLESKIGDRSKISGDTYGELPRKKLKL